MFRRLALHLAGLALALLAGAHAGVGSYIVLSGLPWQDAAGCAVGLAISFWFARPLGEAAADVIDY